MSSSRVTVKVRALAGAIAAAALLAGAIVASDTAATAGHGIVATGHGIVVQDGHGI